MSKFKIINLVDKIFVSVSVFLIIYAWINFFIRDLFLTFGISLIFSFACVYLIFYFTNKKNLKKNLTKTKIFQIEEKFLAYKLMPKSEKLNFLTEILKNNYNNITTLNNAIIFEKEQAKIALIDATHLDKITNNNLLNLINELTNENIKEFQIICNEINADLKLNFLKNSTIKIINKTTLYDDFFKRYNLYPNTDLINLKATKPTIKEIAKNFFLPNKAKSYFFCGLILIFSSVILPYHIYYLLFGTMLLVFSILCKILPRH